MTSKVPLGGAKAADTFRKIRQARNAGAQMVQIQADRVDVLAEGRDRVGRLRERRPARDDARSKVSALWPWRASYSPPCCATRNMLGKRASSWTG